MASEIDDDERSAETDRSIRVLVCRQRASIKPANAGCAAERAGVLSQIGPERGIAKNLRNGRGWAGRTGESGLGAIRTTDLTKRFPAMNRPARKALPNVL